MDPENQSSESEQNIEAEVVSSDDNEDTCSKMDENNSFGQILNSIPTVLERVLAHLPMRELNNCCQVCKAWNQLGKIVKRKRQTLSWIFWAAKRSRKLPPSVCSSCSITEHVRQVLDFASSQPKLGIVFVTNSFFEVQGRFTEESSSSDTPVIDYLMSALPRDCLLFGTCSHGIVGTTLGIKQCSVEVENSEGFSCLLLPEISGLEMHPFIIRHFEDLSEFKSRDILTDDELCRLMKVPVDKTVKALLLFCSHVSEGESGAQLLTNSLLKKQNQQLAVGGAFVETFVAPKSMLSKYSHLPHTMGICICGERVRTASVILNSNVRKRKAVEKVLEQLKACNFPTKKSFALMFACVGRGYNWYKESNVESETFRKMFPDTPLFGLFGNGEIGRTYLPNVDTQDKKLSFSSPQLKKRKLSSNRNLFHGYTTIFVMVSVDK